MFTRRLLPVSMCRGFTHYYYFFFVCINETLASTRPFWRRKKKREREKTPRASSPILFSRFPRKVALRVVPAADRAQSQRRVATMAGISRSLE